MQKLFIPSLTALAASSLLQAQTATKKPNVIIIYTDDQGTLDLNCYGSKDLMTPNIDKLAQKGVMFTQFYAASSISSPSRASLLTGLTPLAAGLPDNASSLRGDKGMPTEKITIAEVLKQNGYVTGHVGKWHLGFTPETMPNGQGFDYSFGHMGGCLDNYSHFFYWHGPNQHDLWENGQEVWMDGQYLQEVTTQRVNSFIDKNKDNAFFLYYAINLPHYPLQGDPKWREYYKGLPSPRNMYAACISTIDDKVGQLLKKLEELHLTENTIIIFQSDQGHSTEERTFGGAGNCGIYRGAKFSFFEGGIHVPAIISWPGKIPQKTVREQMCLNVDWFPTILDFCGITYQPETFEGKTIKGVILKNDSTPHDSFCWHIKKDYWAVRKGDWKLLKNPQDPAHKAPIESKDSLFLVNVRSNPDELVNQAAKYPEKVTELQQTYQKWYKKVTK